MVSGRPAKEWVVSWSGLEFESVIGGRVTGTGCGIAWLVAAILSID